MTQNVSNTIGKLMLSLKDLSRGRSMEKEFALVPQGFIKVLLYLSIGHGNERCTQESLHVVSMRKRVCLTHVVCRLLRTENPTSQPRMQFGEYPKHFIIGKTKLFLGIVSGAKLRDIQSFGTQDPYCEVYISKRRQPSIQDLVYKTKTHNNGGRFVIVIYCV